MQSSISEVEFELVNWYFQTLKTVGKLRSLWKFLEFYTNLLDCITEDISVENKLTDFHQRLKVRYCDRSLPFVLCPSIVCKPYSLNDISSWTTGQNFK